MDTRKHHPTLHLKHADLTSLTFLGDVHIAAIKSPTASGSKATKLIPIYIRNTTDSQVCQRKASLGTPFQLSFWGEKKKDKSISFSSFFPPRTVFSFPSCPSPSSAEDWSALVNNWGIFPVCYCSFPLMLIYLHFFFWHTSKEYLVVLI